MREPNVVVEPERVKVAPLADVTSKDVAEALLERLDQPRNRGGRRIQSNCPEGQLEIWRDKAGRVHIKHPRLRQGERDEISVRLNPRGNFLKSGQNIVTFKIFLETNPLALSLVTKLR